MKGEPREARCEARGCEASVVEAVERKLMAGHRTLRIEIVETLSCWSREPRDVVAARDRSVDRLVDRRPSRNPQAQRLAVLTESGPDLTDRRPLLPLEELAQGITDSRVEARPTPVAARAPRQRIVTDAIPCPFQTGLKVKCSHR